ncbi:MAG TPA: aldolase/citrate lyase family protein [bacterium]|nr:aldolase/citrate lyase family protein [bacterium]
MLIQKMHIVIPAVLTAMSVPAFGQADTHLNKVIAKLERNEVVLGSWFKSMSIYTAMGLVESNAWVDRETGMKAVMIDYVLIDMEHLPFDVEHLQTILMAFHSKREVLETGSLQPSIAPWVRIPCDAAGPIEPYIKQVLDAGAFGVIVPHCTNAKDAERVISACRYPQPKGDPQPRPKGRRGASPDMCAYLWGLTSEEYVSRADVWPLDPNGDLLAILMIEDKEGRKNIDEILSVPGVGAIFFGLYDYSFSCGVEGDMKDPEVMEGFQAVSEACKKHNVPLIVGADDKSVEQRLKDGYRILISGIDLQAPRSLREVYKRMQELKK